MAVRRRILTRVAFLLVAVLSAGGAERAHAGWYAAPAIKWSSFAARPEGQEPTPNYFGYGGGLALGYSIHQAFDLGAFGSYLPGRRQHASFGKEDASLVSYGGEVAFRIGEAVYLGLRGGTSTYRLMRAVDETELRGRWLGVSGGLMLGAALKASQQTFLLTALEISQHLLRADAEEYAGARRRFDSFAISVTYMLNAYDSYRIKNTIFKDFLDSISFF